MSSTPALFRLAAACAAAALLAGCAVVSVASTAVGFAATAASLAVDATVGTAKAVGSVVMPSKAEDKQ
ncbi:hypothetical protein [Ramlibacter sp. PS4R-6]|uniref:hypothetical protein n=1 Tax=Ramlibacter sp. PS4R-6 TaxID=3133438 RepID=UPI0030AF01CD